MATRSKYVTDEDIEEAKVNLGLLDDELKELELAEKAGSDVTKLRENINETRKRLMQFINTYSLASEKTKTSRSR